MSVLQESSGHAALQDETQYLVDLETPEEYQDDQFGFMSNHDDASGTTVRVLGGHKDARALVRLVQCSVCSLILQSPVTLPCGNSICRKCLPTPHEREHVSYPDTLSRRQAIQCPFSDCQLEHTVEDCGVNVVFCKLLDSINEKVVECRLNAGSTQTIVQELPMATETLTEASSGKAIGSHTHLRTLPGARLVATYTLAEMGELDFTSDSNYKDFEPYDESAGRDEEMLGHLKDACQRDLDCHVCYNLMLNPVTTPCGHTFCRKCLARILDHADICPVCRRNLPLQSSLVSQPSDKSLSTILLSICPEEIQIREEQSDIEERSAPGGLDTALFLVTVTFPFMPILLHVFEPRYRLMIRRALETGGQFGMIPHNQHGLPQGNMGRTRFMEMGVMVQIEHFQTLPDGRSFLQCRGVSRFRVIAHGKLDGYCVGRVQKVEDISLADEEQLEIRQMTAARTVPPEQNIINLDGLSTRELFEIGQTFVARARERSAPWLQGRIIDVYGGPPEDPAIFPYWFASVLPLHEDEKYKLLPATSVRERLKITARWVHRIEAQRW